MARLKTKFTCQECGYESAKWLGKCPSCGQWNTFVEEAEDKKGGNTISGLSAKAVNIADIAADIEERFSTGINELDRVLGGGLVKGSMVLVGGEPGIGKSTLILQLCQSIGGSFNILYITGEESVNQVKMRGNRLGVDSGRLMMAAETAFSAVEKLINETQPGLLIVDSIQTVYDELLTSAPGTVSQVREVTLRLMRLAKTKGVVVLLIGHVTKEGSIAGPRVLEHMVDTVLYFEGERHMSYRILRAVKNRFGSTNEIGIFEMVDSGLEQVSNPSEIMLSEKPENTSGSVVAASMEGTRPMLIEIQALVCETGFGMPRRMATGIDYNRIVLLIAVLEKKAGLGMHDNDAYVNVVGGMKVTEPACDLAAAAAIVSSFRNRPVESGTVCIGEIGLTGEVRAVGRIEKRIMEAKRIGFKRCIIPAGNMKAVARMKDMGDMVIQPVDTIGEAISLI